MPPGELQIKVNGMEDLIPGRSGSGGKDKAVNPVRGGHVGPQGSNSREGGGGGGRGGGGRGSGSGRGGGGGESSEGGGGGGGVRTDGTRGQTGREGGGGRGSGSGRGGGGEVSNKGGGGGGGVPTDGTAGQTGPFANMRVLIGCSTPSRDKISKWITELGGSVLSPMHYDLCTHIYLEGETANSGEAYVWLRDNKQIINKSWLKQAFETNMMPENNNEKAPCCSEQMDDCQRTMFRSGRVMRTLSFDEKEEEIIMSNHQLFLCKADTSTRIVMTVYVQEMKKRLVDSVITPGSFPAHNSYTTNPELKGVIKDAYVLLKSLNRAGYSLCGQFSTENFIIDKGKGQLNVRFTGIDADALKKSDPESEDLDIQGFKKMVRRQIFDNKIVPHDLNLWLFLIGKNECEELLPYHIYLLDYSEWTEPFMTWYDTWGNLKSYDIKTYKQILDQLKDYEGWKAVLAGNEKNSYLEDTINFVDPNTKKNVDYSDDAYGLVHMLRNCRHHKALECLRFFALIASQFFPNLISDLQLAMVKVGVIKLPA